MMRHSVSRHSRESGRPVHAVVDVKIETTVIAGSSAFTDDDTEIEGSMKPAALSIAVALVRGKNQMPPWGDFFKPDQLEALWAYVMAGER
jgi:hypothetical protein